MRRALFFTLAAFLFCLPALAQETTNISHYTDYSINRYTVFTGFDYMIRPARNLTERGVEGDFGVTVKPWLDLGADFSAIGDQVFSGAGTINGSETIFAPKLTAAEPFGAPPPSAVHVPFRSTSYTFAVGPQLLLSQVQKGHVHRASRSRHDPRVRRHLLPSPGGKTIPAYRTESASDRYCAVLRVGGGFDLRLSRHSRSASPLTG